MQGAITLVVTLTTGSLAAVPPPRSPCCQLDVFKIRALKIWGKWLGTVQYDPSRLLLLL